MPANTILVAEDDAHDVAFLEALLEECGISNPVQVVPDGEQLIAYLTGKGQFADRSQYPLPILLLLDLKMPRTDGLDALKWLQSTFKPQFPTIVLTGSKDVQEVNLAYLLGARSFLTKPLQKEEFRATVCSLKDIEIESDDDSRAYEHFTPPAAG
jgi:CheY-like chemotaxis protein